MSSDEEDYLYDTDSGNESPEDDDVENDDFVMDIGLGTFTFIFCEDDPSSSFAMGKVYLTLQGMRRDPLDPELIRGMRSTSTRFSPRSRS